ncbi:MAG: dihydrodipicolinate synthase family protein [Thermoguttaceae bacterium]|nr:dihydrodipicolinate synthase family protein [Thermoguttaceae bacterium]
MKKTFSRRDLLGTMTAGAVTAAAASVFSKSHFAAAQDVSSGLAPAADAVPSANVTPAGRPIYGDPRVRGPFPILSTPYKEDGSVDFDVLARSAQFVDWCGSPGMIWPQSGDSLDLLTMEEKLQGMEALADAMKGRKSALCLGVQGKNTEEMLIYARHAEKLDVPCIISRPPDDGKTQEDMREYWRALAKVTNRPVIIQTTGGTTYRGPAPSVELLIDLAKESPWFGYVKEEAANTWQRMKLLIDAKPVIKTVFSAWGGFAWLHQSRLGTEGLITERAVYADLLAKIWEFMEREDHTAAADAFSRLLLMLNLKETIPCNQLRGFHLYVWMKRGIFKNMLSREYAPKNVIPEKPILREMQLTEIAKAEIDSRFEALRPYLREGTFT